MTDAFVPAGFEPPTQLRTTDLLLEPLGPEHNEPDHAAWSSSIEHIHATPGYDDDDADDDPWPVPMTLEENLRISRPMPATSTTGKASPTRSWIPPTVT